MAKNPFALDVEKFAESFIEGAENAVRGVTYNVFSNIIKSTPVDEGRARANWFATGQSPSSKKTNKEDNSQDGKDTAKNMEFVVFGIKDWSKFTLTNNLPYIRHLEEGLYNKGPNTTGGYSTQAPQGMVKINIARANRLLEKEAKKNLPR